MSEKNVQNMTLQEILDATTRVIREKAPRERTQWGLSKTLNSFLPVERLAEMKVDAWFEVAFDTKGMEFDFRVVLKEDHPLWCDLMSSRCSQTTCYSIFAVKRKKDEVSKQLCVDRVEFASRNDSKKFYANKTALELVTSGIESIERNQRQFKGHARAVLDVIQDVGEQRLRQAIFEYNFMNEDSKHSRGHVDWLNEDTLKQLLKTEEGA